MDYKEQALDLSVQVKDAHSRIHQLETALEKANKLLFRLRGSYVPEGEDGALYCPKCGDEILDVDTWEYCPYCGVHFSWLYDDR